MKLYILIAFLFLISVFVTAQTTQFEPIEDDIEDETDCNSECNAYIDYLEEQCHNIYLEAYNACQQAYYDAIEQCNGVIISPSDIQEVQRNSGTRSCRLKAWNQRMECINNASVEQGLCNQEANSRTNSCLTYCASVTTGTQYNPPVCFFADTNFDGFVNLPDYQVFSNCLADSGPQYPYPPFMGCERLDFNADGDIDLQDFQIFQQCFSGDNFYPGYDDDHDNVSFLEDNCLNTYNPLQEDIDYDGSGDVCDNCITDYNPEQGDIDLDNSGDICDNIYTCCFNDFGNNDTENCQQMVTSACEDSGGYVSECLPQKVNVERLPPAANVTYAPVNRTLLNSYLQNLTMAVNATGIHTRRWNVTSYNCQNFSDDLERNLTSVGYNSTWTSYWCYHANGTPRTAHAVVDIHPPSGGIVFVEPQSGRIINNDLDFDGDGMIEYRTHHENNRVDTDDRCEIEVYDNRATAQAAGVPGA